MYREPWFSILEVYEPRGRSMADIVAETSKRVGVSLDRLRSRSTDRSVWRARSVVYCAIRSERPDLTSTQVAKFFDKEPSTVRKFWRKADRSQA